MVKIISSEGSRLKTGSEGESLESEFSRRQFMAGLGAVAGSALTEGLVERIAPSNANKTELKKDISVEFRNCVDILREAVYFAQKKVESGREKLAPFAGAGGALVFTQKSQGKPLAQARKNFVKGFLGGAGGQAVVGGHRYVEMQQIVNMAVDVYKIVTQRMERQKIQGDDLVGAGIFRERFWGEMKIRVAPALYEEVISLYRKKGISLGSDKSLPRKNGSNNPTAPTSTTRVR